MPGLRRVDEGEQAQRIGGRAETHRVSLRSNSWLDRIGQAVAGSGGGGLADAELPERSTGAGGGPSVLDVRARRAGSAPTWSPSPAPRTGLTGVAVSPPSSSSRRRRP